MRLGDSVALNKPCWLDVALFPLQCFTLYRRLIIAKMTGDQNPDGTMVQNA